MLAFRKSDGKSSKIVQDGEPFLSLAFAALLVPHLSVGRPLPLAEAGASAVMGYPLWGELIAGLAHKAAALTLSGDYLGDVDRIATAAAGAGRKDEYFKCLAAPLALTRMGKLFLKRYTVPHVRKNRDLVCPDCCTRYPVDGSATGVARRRR